MQLIIVSAALTLPLGFTSSKEYAELEWPIDIAIALVWPHLWGSKRTGPDLHRMGGKYNDVWHWKHMRDPRSIVPDSMMPAYKFPPKNHFAKAEELPFHD